MQYSEQEMRERKRHFGPTLSVIDRRKFAREFDVRYVFEICVAFFISDHYYNYQNT